VSNLENKSELNIEAARKLIEENLYAPSVHCSYYSCFQLLKFKMNDFFDVTYEQLTADISSSPKGTHEYIIDFYIQTIRNNANNWKSVDFKRNIKDLKLFREKSDYEDINITKNQSDKAYRTAEYLLKFIKDTF